MRMILSVCRVCLSYSNHVRKIANTPLQKLYEKITGNQLISEDGRPESFCYLCHSVLQRCCKFVDTSQKTEEFFTHFFLNGIELTEDILIKQEENNHLNTISHLSRSNISHLSINNPDIKQYKHIKKEAVEYYEVAIPNSNNKIDSATLEHTSKKEDNSDDQQHEEYKSNDDDMSGKETDSEETKECQGETLKVKFEKPSNSKPSLNGDNENHIPKNIEKNNVPTHLKPLYVNLEKPKENSITSLYCRFCLKNFKSKQYFKRHLRIHTGETPYTCTTCNETFRDSVILKQHVRTHSGKGYVCDVCSKEFPVIARLKEHHKVHTGEKPFACPKCHCTFSHKNSLTRHIRIHSGDKPFMCQTCSKQFRQASNLRKHEQSCNKRKRTITVLNMCLS